MDGAPSEKEARPERRPSAFPWIVLLLLVASVYVFWVLPGQLPDRPVKVEFVEPKGEASTGK